MKRGFFAIGAWHPKTSENIGTLWRSAHLLGASMIFTIGRRYKGQPSDTTKAYKSLPLMTFESVEELKKIALYDCPLIGVELDSRASRIESFCHPERACYLLGAEDHGLSPDVRKQCHKLVQLPGEFSMNVASAGTVVMYDRLVKRGV